MANKKKSTDKEEPKVEAPKVEEPKVEEVTDNSAEINAKLNELNQKEIKLLSFINSLDVIDKPTKRWFDKIKDNIYREREKLIKSVSSEEEK